MSLNVVYVTFLLLFYYLMTAEFSVGLHSTVLVVVYANVQHCWLN